MLIATLHDASRQLCFVAGQVSAAGGAGLLIRPTTLVFEGGPTRLGLQPWVESGAATNVTQSQSATATVNAAPQTPGHVVARYPMDIIDLLGELLLLGLRRADAQLARRWRDLAREGESLGYSRLAQPVSSIALQLTNKLGSPDWTTESIRPLVLTMAVLARLALDLQDVAAGS
jgi:hypothetical protein